MSYDNITDSEFIIVYGKEIELERCPTYSSTVLQYTYMSNYNIALLLLF